MAGTGDPSKTLCVMGLFDPEAGRAFETLCDALLQMGFPAVRQKPHLTFGIYNDLSRKKLADWVGAIARSQGKISVNFNHIGLFREGICFAEPCVNRELLDLHRRIHARYDRNCSDKNCLYSLKWKSWVPHVTLAVPEPAQLPRLIPVLLDLFHPIQATVTDLEITEYPPLKSICRYPLLGLTDCVSK